jgi:hypothetical protein
MRLPLHGVVKEAIKRIKISRGERGIGLARSVVKEVLPGDE